MAAQKLNESAMIAHLRAGEVLLAPLMVREVMPAHKVRGGDSVDARLEVGIPGQMESYRLAVESKSRSTPEIVRSAIAQVKSVTVAGEWPMIQVPYLSPSQLDELERAGVSGVDLCGNGIIHIPGRLYISRSGQPNQYPDSRPLNNPYAGRSAMVGRMLLQRPQWKSLTELAAAIELAGAKLSLAQVSKAVQAMKEDLLVVKQSGSISLIDAGRLLDQLGSNWKKPGLQSREAVRIPSGTEWVGALSSDSTLKWAVAGESSATRYTMFSQGGPRMLAVSDAALAQKLLNAKREPVRSFADLDLIETTAPDFYFGSEIDDDGIHWASQVQTWLELQCGDARQQEAAQDLRGRILKDVRS
ncbi:MAG: hypothetical protein JNM43_23470 [Planctomycetaceae bacterium]|nr:hypothetical protein [Planctomycetaceae bacterium]